MQEEYQERLKRIIENVESIQKVNEITKRHEVIVKTYEIKLTIITKTSTTYTTSN